MPNQFEPAPYDKYAESPEDIARLSATDPEADLEAGLVGTFPASDPLSATQPAPHAEANPGGLLSKITAIFTR